MVDDVGRKFVFAGKVINRVRVVRLSQILQSRPEFRNLVWEIRYYGQNQDGEEIEKVVIL